MKRRPYKLMRRFGWVHIDNLPMRDFAVSYHSPRHWDKDGEGNWIPGEPRKTALITIEGTLRGGRRVSGDLKETESEGISK